MKSALAFVGTIIAWSGVLAQAPTPDEGSARSSSGAPTGLRYVVFDRYSPLSRNPDLLRRVLSPLAAETIRRRLESSGQTLLEQSIDLSKERFVVYAPPRPPPRGYALMVFVPPWQDAKAPVGWGPVLDRYGMIFVSAARSGNDQNVVARREPLALIEVENIVARYKVDPDRIYVGGFSGGARVALRIALAFPDIFHGAVLDAGSDPIGAGGVPLPSRDLMSRFQDSTRLVYVTGSRDVPSQTLEAESARSMQDNCVYNIDRQTPPWSGHDVIGPDLLSQALTSLTSDQRTDTARLAACRAKLERDLDERLRTIDDLIERGQRGAARELILGVDRRFGGLAAPESLDAAVKCDCGVFGR